MGMRHGCGRVWVWVCWDGSGRKWETEGEEREHKRAWGVVGVVGVDMGMGTTGGAELGLGTGGIGTGRNFGTVAYDWKKVERETI